MFRFKHFGGVSKVKFIFSLLVSTGNDGDELSYKEPDELLQNPIRLEITFFFSMNSPSNILFLPSIAPWHHHYFAYVEMIS